MQSRHREKHLHIYITSRINLCVAHEKTVDPCTSSSLPARALLPWEFRIIIDCGSNSDRQTKHENHEKTDCSSPAHTLITTHTKSLFSSKKTRNRIFLKSGPQGRLNPSIISTQREAFVRWITNKLSEDPPPAVYYTHTTSDGLAADNKHCPTSQIDSQASFSPFNSTKKATFLRAE